MNKNIEKIDGYLKGVALPEHTSEQHRQQLRRQILNKIERRKKMFVRNKSWKIAAAIALICTGVAAAAVVGIKITKYYFVSKHPEAGYLLSSEDGLIGRTIPDSWADSPEQAVEIAEEIDLLRQQDARELVSVVEKEVNGRLISRYFKYKYILSDGREIKSGDRDPDLKERLTEAQEEELMNLFQADKYVRIGFENKEFRGCTFSFERNRFVLSDGTEVVWSVGRPK
jgi:hypothetical protein